MNSSHRFHAAKQFGDEGRETHPTLWAAQFCLIVTFVTTIVLAGFVWLIPIEVIQQWALDRAKPDPFSRFEAVGSAEFTVWLCRINDRRMGFAQETRFSVNTHDCAWSTETSKREFLILGCEHY